MVFCVGKTIWNGIKMKYNKGKKQTDHYCRHRTVAIPLLSSPYRYCRHRTVAIIED